MDKLELGAIAIKAVPAIAAAAMIGGGTMVLRTSNEVTLQNQRISTLEDREEDARDTLESLNRNVQSLDKSVAVLAERLKEPKNAPQ